MTEKEICKYCSNKLQGLWIRPKKKQNSTIRIKNYLYCEKCEVVFMISLGEVTNDC